MKMKKKIMHSVITWIITGFLLMIVSQGYATDTNSPAIYISQEAAQTEKLAGSEIRKYIYQRTGKLLAAPAINQIITIAE